MDLFLLGVFADTHKWKAGYHWVCDTQGFPCPRAISLCDSGIFLHVARTGLNGSVQAPVMERMHDDDLWVGRVWLSMTETLSYSASSSINGWRFPSTYVGLVRLVEALDLLSGLLEQYWLVDLALLRNRQVGLKSVSAFDLLSIGLRLGFGLLLLVLDDLTIMLTFSIVFYELPIIDK